MKIGRLPVPAFNDHSVAITHAGVTGRAVDVEAFAAALHHSLGDRKWKAVLFLQSDFPSVEIRIVMQFAASDGVHDWLPFR